MEALKIVLLIIGSYLLGNVNFATIITKLKKQDVRKIGSGNPGAMNMFRSYGKALGCLTLALDALKGAIPCLVGWWLIGEPYSFGTERLGMYIGAFSVIIGHIFPVFLKFKGGKGIASSIGICLVFSPLVTVIAFVIGVLYLIFAKMGSITSFMIIAAPIALEAFRVSENGGNIASSILIFAIFFMTIFAHRKNIVKLFSGKENPTVLFGRKKAAASKNKI